MKIFESMKEAFQAWLDNKGTKLWFIAKIQKWAVVGLALAAVFFAITSCATQGNIASVYVIDGDDSTEITNLKNAYLARYETEVLPEPEQWWKDTTKTITEIRFRNVNVNLSLDSTSTDSLTLYSKVWGQLMIIRLNQKI